MCNGKLLKQNIFEDIWVQPAAGDAGGSLGAALLVWHQKFNNSKNNDNVMKNSLLGDHFNDEQIKMELERLKANFVKYDYAEMINQTAYHLSQKKTVGWFQNRSEFGPRALGARSILADPRDPNMQKKLNLQIKFRESFRPFAPVVLEQYTKDWFDIDKSSPFMLFVANVKKNNILIPAVTHVDGSARIQTVNETNDEIYDLLKKFNEITSCPILINTSFNVNREPIVNDVKDAYKSFLISGLDILICGNYILKKEDQYAI